MTKNEFDNLRERNTAISAEIQASIKVIGTMPASNDSARAYGLLQNSTEAQRRLTEAAIDMAAEATANLAHVEEELAEARAKLEQLGDKKPKADGKRSEVK